MSFSETIFLFVLALVIFGPKKLPEIARQAGRLLAELRRASNEFRSQIETEIAHLEVEKSQAVLPPAAPPQGTVATVASLSANSAAAESVAREPGATLADPAAVAAPLASVEVHPPVASENAENSSQSAASSPEASAVSVSAAQDSHV